MKKGPIFTYATRAEALIFPSLLGQAKGPTGANFLPVSKLKIP